MVKKTKAQEQHCDTAMHSNQQHEYRLHVRAFHQRHPNLKGVDLFHAEAKAWRDKKEEERKKELTPVKKRYRARTKQVVGGRTIIRGHQGARQGNRERRERGEREGFMKVFVKEECAICLEPFDGKETCLVCKRGHIMHCDCIRKWDAAKKECKCPVCKEPCFKIEKQACD